MNTDKYTEDMKKILSSDGSWTIYSGLDGYVMALLVRMNSGAKIVKQMINGHAVAQYHQATDMWVKEIIQKRVELGMKIKNLVCFEDTDLEIEKSNNETLKESRYVDKDSSHKSMVAVFGDYVTILDLSDDISDSRAVIIKNKSIAASVELLFDSKWNNSKSF